MDTGADDDWATDFLMMTTEVFGVCTRVEEGVSVNVKMRIFDNAGTSKGR